MTVQAAPALDALVVVVALLAGYAVGSVPLASRIARSAGVDARLLGDGEPEPGAVWALAGPGWGFLALTAALAKGVVPTAIGIVTWSWAAGWAAGLGALLGASMPWFGRMAGGRGTATFAGVVFTLAPPAGTLSGALALVVLAIGRLAGRDARAAAVVAGFAAFPFLFLLVDPDLVHLAALAVLYAVAIARGRTTGGR